eukprot:641891_1
MAQTNQDNEGKSNEQSQKSKFLTREDVINGTWLFFNDNGFLGEMKLLNNGKISGYTTGNERTWELKTIAYGYTILEFYGDNHKKTWQAISAIRDATGLWKLQGPFTPDPKWKNYLMQVE